MKKNSISIVLIALLVIGIVTAVYAKAHSTYYVQNDTKFIIGNVTLNLQSGNSVVVNVTGNGVFSADVTSSVTSVVINNVTAPLGSTTNITTANGDKVNCTPFQSGPATVIN